MMISTLFVMLLSALSAGTATQPAHPAPASPPAAPHAASASTATATFAGGCFWCMEHPFDAVDGVISTTSGYAGGPEQRPTYERSPREPQGTWNRCRWRTTRRR